MFTKIKEFLFGKPSEIEAPYKIEAVTPKVEIVPLGTEVSVVPAPVAKPAVVKAVKPAPAKRGPAAKKSPAPKKPVASKAPAKPRAPAKPNPAK